MGEKEREMPDQTIGSFERGLRLFEKMIGPSDARPMRAAWRKLEPDFERYVLTFGAGEIWSRPGLDRRTPGPCTVAALSALGRRNGLELNIPKSVGNGA